MPYYGSDNIKEKKKTKHDNLCPRGVYILVERDWKEMKKITEVDDDEEDYGEKEGSKGRQTGSTVGKLKFSIGHSGKAPLKVTLE